MDMASYWDYITTVSRQQLLADHPEAGAGLDALEMDLTSVDGAEYAFAVIPSLGPGGGTSDEDDADMDSREEDGEDPTEDIVPSVTGEQAPMAYFADSDSLYVMGTDGVFRCWNY